MALEGLNPKQRLFVEYYLGVAHLNATKAARLAGYAEPGQQGHRLLKNVQIAEAIKERVAEAAMAADEALYRLADHARATIEDFMEEGEEFVRLETGRRNGKLHLIRKFGWDKEGRLAIELHDAQAALIQIGRHHGLFTDRNDVTLNGKSLRELSDAELLAAATGAAPRNAAAGTDVPGSGGES